MESLVNRRRQAAEPQSASNFNQLLDDLDED